MKDVQVIPQDKKGRKEAVPLQAGWLQGTATASLPAERGVHRMVPPCLRGTVGLSSRPRTWPDKPREDEEGGGSQINAGRGPVTIATLFFFEHRLGGLPCEGISAQSPGQEGRLLRTSPLAKAALLNSLGLGGRLR